MLWALAAADARFDRIEGKLAIGDRVDYFMRARGGGDEFGVWRLMDRRDEIWRECAVTPRVESLAAASMAPLPQFQSLAGSITNTFG